MKFIHINLNYRWVHMASDQVVIFEMWANGAKTKRLKFVSDRSQNYLSFDRRQSWAFLNL